MPNPNATVSTVEGPIGIAGAGRVAQSLGRLLRERGEPVVAMASRNPEHAAEAAAFVGEGVAAVSYGRLARGAKRLLVAVPDHAVTGVARMLADAGMREGMALHTCGARGPEALGPLAEAGVDCATLHPLQTVANPGQGLTALPGAAFAITGEGPAAQWATRIANLLEGRVLHIAAERRALYHAAAVMASNYVVGLIDAAVVLMNAAGVEPGQARLALAPLMESSVRNAVSLGPAKALTGPIERGDSETVEAHLEALGEVGESVQNLYRCAGLHVVELARQRGLDEPKARLVEERLREVKHHA